MKSTEKAQRLARNINDETGTLSFALKSPTLAEINPPIQIWTKPIKADALPKFLEKGARASADPFGNVMPRHARRTKKNEIVE